MSQFAKLFRMIGLLSQGVFIQFLHPFAYVALLGAAVVGYLRWPSYLIIVLGIVSGIGADKIVSAPEFGGFLEKASAAQERGGFVVIVYFFISFAGYLLGAYARHKWNAHKAAAPASKTPEKK